MPNASLNYAKCSLNVAKCSLNERSLPYEVLALVIDLVATSGGPQDRSKITGGRSLAALATTCLAMRHVLAARDQAWHAAARARWLNQPGGLRWYRAAAVRAPQV
jgi:hypothetical protein